MRFFGKLKASQASSGPAPVKKPAAVVHPDNAPRTIRDSEFPEDFALYEYDGTTVETVATRGTNGEIIRRPAMVARMIRKYVSEEGASVVEEMTATLADLMAFKRLEQAQAIRSPGAS